MDCSVRDNEKKNIVVFDNLLLYSIIILRKTFIIRLRKAVYYMSIMLSKTIDLS